MDNKKEYLYIGHYIDENGNYILKVGTTNDLDRRRSEHIRNYRRCKNCRLPKENTFEYDWYCKLSKYNTLRYEDKIRKEWQEKDIGIFVRNDRFCLNKKPDKIIIKIRKEYEISL